MLLKAIATVIGYVVAGPFAVMGVRLLVPNLVFFSLGEIVTAVLCWPWIVFCVLTGRLEPR